MDDGAVPITDPGERDVVRRQARSVHVRAVGAALVLTALYIIVT